MDKTAEQIEQERLAKEEETKKQLEAANKQAEELAAELSNTKKFMENPVVAAAMEAVKDGREVDIVDSAQVSEDDLKSLITNSQQNLTDEGKTKLDNLSSSQVIEIMTDAVEKAITQQRASAEKEIGKRLEEVGKGMSNLKDGLLNVYAKMELEKVQDKYKDFGEHAEAVRAIIKESPQVGLENAFKIAKFNAVEKSPPKKETDSERPDSHSVVGDALGHADMETITQRKKNKTEQEPDASLSPVNSFRGFLSDAIDKVVAENQGKK